MFQLTSKSKTNLILTLVNLTIFSLGGMYFFGSFFSFSDTLLYNELYNLIIIRKEFNISHWDYLTVAYSLLQSIFLTIRLIPTIWEIQEYRSAYLNKGHEFWESESILYFVIGMWILLIIFFQLVMFPFLYLLLGLSSTASVDIKPGVSIHGLSAMTSHLLIGIIGVISFYLIFYIGRKYYPKRYYIFPLIIFIFFLVYMLPVFF